MTVVHALPHNRHGQTRRDFEFARMLKQTRSKTRRRLAVQLTQESARQPVHSRRKAHLHLLHRRSYQIIGIPKAAAHHVERSVLVAHLIADGDSDLPERERQRRSGPTLTGRQVGRLASVAGAGGRSRREHTFLRLLMRLWSCPSLASFSRSYWFGSIFKCRGRPRLPHPKPPAFCGTLQSVALKRPPSPSCHRHAKSGPECLHEGTRSRSRSRDRDSSVKPARKTGSKVQRARR